LSILVLILILAPKKTPNILGLVLEKGYAYARQRKKNQIFIFWSQTFTLGDFTLKNDSIFFIKYSPIYQDLTGYIRFLISYDV